MKKTLLCGMAFLIATSAGAVSTTPTPGELRQLEKEGKVRKLTRHIAATPTQARNLLQFPSEKQATIPFGDFLGKDTTKNDPLRLTAKGVNLYGYLSYTNRDEDAGMYRFTEDGYNLFWEDPMVAANGPQAFLGWYADDVYWGISYTSIFGFMVNYDEFVIDFNDGVLLSYESHLFDTDVMFVNLALNTDNDKVYGFAFDFSTDGDIYWACANMDLVGEATVLRKVSDLYCYALAYNPEDGYFYGVTDEQEFVRISLNGDYIVLADLSGHDLATYLTGMVYSQAINAFYWTPYFNDGSSALAIISPAGNIEFVEDYAWGPNFTTLINTDQYVSNPDRPGIAEVDSIEFTDASLTGEVVYTLPSTFLSEDKFPEGAILSYTALLDNTFYKMGTGKPGETVTIEYTVKEKGYHTFGLTCSYNRVNGFTAEKVQWIGNDAPFAPTDVRMTQTEVSWNPVIASGIHGGYVNPAEVTYNVYINNKLVGSTKETSLAITLPDDQPFSTFRASVTGVFDGMEGPAGYSNYVAAGEALPLPFFMQPTPEEFRLFTVEDANDDGITWVYNTTNKGISVSPTKDDLAVDDYAFLPPLEFSQDDLYYYISLQAACWMASLTHYDSLELVWATEPCADKVGGVIIPAFAPLLGKFEIIEKYWKVPQPGTYYIGVHCASQPDQNGVVVKNFEIKESAVSDNSPAAPEIISTTSENGSLETTVTIKLPTQTFGGGALDASAELTAHVVVNGNEEGLVSGRPGEEVKATVLTQQGDNRITVYLSAGELESPRVSTVVTSGVSIPANPKNLKFTVWSDMLTAYLSWDPVTESNEEGGYIDPAGVRYNIYLGVNFGFGDEWEILDEGISATNYTLELPKDAPQALYRLGVASYNAAGTTGSMTAAPGDIMGTPYLLPFVENLENDLGVFDTAPWFMRSTFDGVSYDALWAIDYLSNMGVQYEIDRPVIVGYTFKADTKGLLSMPYISTIGAETAEFSITCLTGSGIASLTVYGSELGSDELVEIGTVNASNLGKPEFRTYNLILPASLMGKDWVGLQLMAVYSDPEQIFAFSNIEISANSGVSTIVSAESAIFGGTGVITVIGHEGDAVSVSSIDGKSVCSMTAESGHVYIPVTKGMYVVSAGTQTAKVIVR